MHDPNEEEVGTDQKGIDHGNGISTGGRTLVGQVPEGVFSAVAEAEFQELLRNPPSVSDAPPGVFLTDD